MINIEELLYKEALKAYKKGEVPVGCVIVKDDKVLAKAHNTRQGKHCLLNHAEINAIIKADKRLKDWRLDGCDLYVTLKPCDMCFEAIKQARIEKIYYIVDSKFNNSTRYATLVEYLSDEKAKFANLLSNFFKNKR